MLTKAVEACKASIEGSKGRMVVKEEARAVSEKEERALEEELQAAEAANREVSGDTDEVGGWVWFGAGPAGGCGVRRGCSGLAVATRLAGMAGRRAGCLGVRGAALARSPGAVPSRCPRARPARTRSSRRAWTWMWTRRACRCEAAAAPPALDRAPGAPPPRGAAPLLRVRTRRRGPQQQQQQPCFPLPFSVASLICR